MGGISIWQLLIILLIVVLVFGSKKLKGLGKDLGGAVQGFKEELGSKEKADSNEEDEALNLNEQAAAEPNTATADATFKQEKEKVE